MTKNITLSVPVQVLRAVRRVAVEHDTTVNGVVRGYLSYLAQTGEPLSESLSHEERLNRLDAIWKVIDQEKARIGRKLRRGLAYEGRHLS